MKKRLRIALTVLSTAALLGTGAISSAQAETVTSSQADQLSQFWTAHDVPQATQRVLLAKIESGKVIDALKSDHVAVSEVTADRGGLRETTSTYKDGSIGIASVELPAVVNGVAVAADGPVTGVSRCSLSTYSGVASYSNCLVGYTATGKSFNFNANFTLVTGASNDYIRDKGTSGTVSCVTYCTTPAFQTWKANEDSGGKAYLTYATEWNLAGTTSSTLFLTLVVGGNTYSAHA